MDIVEKKSMDSYFDIILDYMNPCNKTCDDKKIKEFLKNAGILLNVRYLSYIEILTIENSPFVNEKFLWSHDKGDMIDIIWEKNNPDILQIKDNLQSVKFWLLKYSNVQGIIHRIMQKRNSGCVLFVPVKSEKKIYGSITAWDADENRQWTNHEIDFLRILSKLIATELNECKIKEKLHNREEQFSTIIENIGDYFFRTDHDGNIISASLSMAIALGFRSIEELIGTSFEALLNEPERWTLFLAELVQKNGVQDYELTLKGFNNEKIYGSISCRMLYDELGSFQGLEGLIRDISRRMQYQDMMEENQWKLDLAQNIAKIGIWSYDIVTKEFKVTKEVFTMFNAPSDLNSITLDWIIARTPEEEQQKFKKNLETALSSPRELEKEFKVNFDDLKYKFILIKSRPLIRNNVVTGAIGIFQDITINKEAEQHLIKYASELNQKTIELDSLRTQLLGMNREMEERVKARTEQIEKFLIQKDEFIIQIGHDLKTPLTPLVSMLPYVKKGVTDPEIIDIVDMLISDAGIMKELINKILEMAKMNAFYKDADKTAINIAKQVDEIIKDNSYMIHQKSITVINNLSDTLTTNFSKIHFDSLLSNVIGNAVKYSYIEGVITIDGEESDGFITIKIMDTGIGIEAENLDRIFDSFFRADISRHERDSHGLGLTISKQIVNRYGGYIWAESKGIGKGTTFFIKLKSE